MLESSFAKHSLCLFFSVIILAAYNPAVAKTHPPMSSAQTSVQQCEPTPADYVGPYYESGAPVRSRVGKGYNLVGRIMSSTDCAPIVNAQIEFWLTNSSGTYDDDHRATVFSNGIGEYSFESNFPPGYYGRPPHIHIRISAEGFKTLATQHYPGRGDSTGRFDIVLVPKN
jgi:protocatechuate 3,4-dioxygenase beta subunit